MREENLVKIYKYLDLADGEEIRMQLEINEIEVKLLPKQNTFNPYGAGGEIFVKKENVQKATYIIKEFKSEK